MISAKREEDNRMGKTRNLLKKIRDTKGIFYAKMGTIKELYGPNRSRRFQEVVARIHRRTVQKKIFTTQIIMML